MSGRPDDLLASVDDATLLVQARIAQLTDDQVREPSRLPGWTRGHVLTHIARNADGLRNIAEAAARGEVGEQYPGGQAERDGDIEAGAGRPAGDHRVDVRDSQRALDNAWARLSDAAWERSGIVLGGASVTVRETALRRLRELLVHLVDLDLGFEATDLPRAYLERDHDWLAQHRPEILRPDRSD